MPIETFAPFGQTELDEAIWTFHSPSNVAAAAGVAIDMATISSKRVAITGWRNCPMASPFDCTPVGSHTVSPGDVMGVTPPLGARFWCEPRKIRTRRDPRFDGTDTSERPRRCDGAFRLGNYFG